MQFLVMGPIQALNQDREVKLRGSKITTVLAALLLSRGRVVSDSVLADWLWGDAPPATAQAQIQTYASRLRGLLGPEVRIDRQRPGYRISSREHGLDLLEFERLTALGRNAMAARHPEEASAHFSAALSLWRGPALAGVSDFLATVEGPRLEEARLVVLEDRIDADLEIGRHGELIAELLALVAEHPHRERPRTQLMRALHQCGRRVEALEVYHDYRRLLVNDLGLEPSARLQEVHYMVLNEDLPLPRPARISARGTQGAVPEISHDTGPSAAWTPLVRPAELPPAPVDFTGRTAEVEDICAWMTARDGHGGSPPVCVILGMPGIGKTALALFAAHRLRDQYPDGQLHIDLGPNAAAEPSQALRDLLQALGVDAAAMPDNLEDLTRFYRSCVSGRRLLIVVDNALNEEQIRPLLPGTSGCGVLITSRGRLAAL
ncbi:BTAD domain-containing putative transcriptional regulator, partial [Streptomyces sp. NPDC058964]|uniref:AfsR/SARP family transcriptional regulator n=1 Tax=Streptomyces sp. NPDC058964 TaxID=3346681 RepID=UPI0036CF3FC7